jgi:hypothetical protein
MTSLLDPIEPAEPSRLYLTRKEAADYISARIPVEMSASILAERAMEGTGPRYVIWQSGRRTAGHGGRGRPALYTTADLDEWISKSIIQPTLHR